MDIKEVLKQKQKTVNEALKKYLSARYLNSPRALREALKYSVLSGGKRFRPVLTLLTAEALGKSEKKVLPAACALELIHNFSLIHDDLPCMDNDDYRRGRPTCHKKFNEAVALLAGDELLAYAFKIAADSLNINPKDKIKIINELADAASCMIAGQTLDITLEPEDINDAVLNYIHSHKTGALIRCAARMSAIICEAAPKQIHNLTSYAQDAGLIFQITDDILDMGQKDEKISFPALYGVSESKKIANRLGERALKSIKGFDKKADNLRNLVCYLLDRKK